MYSTELSALQSGVHGRMRRQERGIAKVTLQSARRYGMCEHAAVAHNSHATVVKYTYAGVTFVYNPIIEKEITSYASPDYASPMAGTRCTLPVLLRPKYSASPARRRAEQLRHAQIRSRFFQESHASVTSHTVFVVDSSGSMRTDDVDGARCRSDAVWTSLARDSVQSAIESGAATVTDVVSVVVMGEEATTILRCDPTDWILYNTLLEFREWDTIRPEGHGHYMPALEEASSLLEQYDTGKQTMALVFVSDGMPSDDGDFVGRFGDIAKRYGRRLKTTCIGIGEDGDFDIMQKMTVEAESFQCSSQFYKATVNTASLSKILTNLSSMVAASKLELTTTLGSQLQVRKNVLREKQDAPDDLAITNDWTIYHDDATSATHHDHLINSVVRVWAWNRAKDDFVCLIDPRCVICFQTVADSSTMEPDESRGILCGGCRACFVCHACNGKIQHRQKHSTLECNAWLKKRRNGDIVCRPLPSFSIAIKNKFFSEGVERLVAKVRYLDVQGDFLGKKIVAKQSRFVEEENSYENRMDYHRQFLRTQSIAAEMASKFNQAIQKLEQQPLGTRRFPEVTFLEPLVFELANENGEEVNHLVEEMLEGTYEKFNNNMGFVSCRHQQLGYEYCDEGGDSFPVAQTITTTKTSSTLSSRINSIFESAGTQSSGLTTTPETASESDEEECIAGVDPYDVVQAFSHFSFERSKKNFIVVDLQGVFMENASPSPKFVLTDPAIHTRSKASRISRLNLGRTDRGDKGITTFFSTHVCGETCQQLGLAREAP